MAETRPFPLDKPRSGWIVRERIASHYTDNSRWVEFEYEVYEDLNESIRLGGLPFLLANHKAQLRETHQRIRRDADGRMLHESGALIELRETPTGDSVMADSALPAGDTTDFTTDTRYHVWVGRRPNGNWVDSRNRQMAPFLFPRAPWAGSGDEELDPQWLRETFTLPLAGQVADCIARRLARAEAKQESGDKRGTTLNLQVGASSDDASQVTSDVVNLIATTVLIDDTTEHCGLRWTNVTIPGGSTINAATLTLVINDTTEDEPQHQVRGQAADNAGTFTLTSNDIDGRARTTASVQWNAANLGAIAGSSWEWGAPNGSPTAGANLNTVVEEITDRAGWVSGNALVMIYEQHTLSATRDLGIRTFDNASSVAANLYIDYKSGATIFQTLPAVAVGVAVPSGVSDGSGVSFSSSLGSQASLS